MHRKKKQLYAPLSHSEIKKLQKTAIQAAYQGGTILLKKFRKKLKINQKPNNAGIVTDADLASEAAILKLLKKQTPHFNILTEESPQLHNLKDTPGRWIVDPLDGTTNFSMGYPLFCVSLAAEWENELVACATYCPLLNEIYTAGKQQGAFLNQKRIKVSGTTQLSQSTCTLGLHLDSSYYPEQQLQFFTALHRQTQTIRRSGSACLDLAYVAKGTFDAYWECGLSEWDIAAGQLLLEEAGGTLETRALPGNAATPTFTILASNSCLHPALKEQLRLYFPQS